MVVLDKTYNGARSMVQRIAAFGMIILGFALLLFTPSSKHVNPFNQAMGGDGVAYADAPACTECASLEGGNCY